MKISKFLLHALAVLIRLGPVLLLTLFSWLFEWIARGCDELSNMCYRGNLQIQKLVPIPWMLDLVKATEADSDRRRTALLKHLGES